MKTVTAQARHKQSKEAAPEEMSLLYGTPLWGIYIPHFDQISVKISVFGVLCPNRCTDGGEIWHGAGDQSPCRPCGAKNLKIGL